jgi:hypothetical protein
MNAEDYEWVGIIYQNDVRSGVTFITPLAFYNNEGMWESIAFDARHQWFPNNGKVAIFEKDFPRARVGRLWLFHPEQNTLLTDPYAHGHSHYLVSGNLEPVPLAQIINWTARVNNSFDLPDLLDQGIDAQICYCQRIYICCQSRVYGPIRIELDADRFKPREYIQSSSAGGHPLFVWMYTLPEDGILNLTDTHTQFTLLDESMLDTPTGKEDWSLPQVTIKQALQASNQTLAETEGHVHLVDKRIRELARLSSQEGPRALHLDPATLKRAQYILSNQIGRLQELRALTAHLAELSPEHPLMKAARDWEIQARSKEIERAAEALTQDKQERLQQLQTIIEEAEVMIDQLQNTAKDAQKRHEQAIEALNAFERAVRERLAILKEEPLRVLAELQITASLFPMLVDESRQSPYEMRIPSSYSSVARDFYDAELEETVSMSGLDWGLKDNSESIQVELRELQLKRWSQIAQQTGANPKDVRICTAALLAGLTPALAGDAAIPTLRAVAQVIAHGRVTIVPVSLTALTTLDLFGAIDSHRRAFVPSNGLADCILEAQEHPDELVVVILEGIDRVPGMPTYVPLLRQYIEARQHEGCAGNKTPANLFHPRAVTANDPYLKLAWFTWPSNVLLATMLDDDQHSLASPSICDRWLVRRETTLKEDAAFSPKTIPSYSSVSLERWRTWEEEVSTNTVNSTALQGFLDQRQKLFHTALTILNIKDPDAVVEYTWPEQFQQDEEEAK